LGVKTHDQTTTGLLERTARGSSIVNIGPAGRSRAAAFEAGFFERLDPAKMFSGQCLCCGRPLTDPVSQARLIGPECAGDASANIGRIFELAA
jgi:hypothetical protein